MTDVKASILVVDDHPDNLRTLSAVLNQHGYRVRKAISGTVALETVQSQPPDLILLDIRMPEVDGYDVCGALKACQQTCDIPIIFLSALDDSASKVKAFELGGADYITKPFQGEEVLARVRNQLTIQRQQQQLVAQNQQLRQEIHDRQQAQAATELLLSTIQAVSEAADLNTALKATLDNIRAAIDWDYCEAWTIDEAGKALRLAQVCYDQSDLPMQQFDQASNAYTFSHGVGLPGQIWASQQPQWLADLSQIPVTLFPRTQLTEAVGFKTGFGVPIASDNQVLAILLFFDRTFQLPDLQLLKLVNGIALHLGTSIQRKQAEADLKQANRKLHHLATIDGLTQIPNRRCFDAYLKAEWGRSQREKAPLSLLLCDIDYFKRYNDRYGHQAGDHCLQQVVQALKDSIKRPADLAARYGGEEFAIILPNTPAKGAVHVAKRIRRNLARLQILHENSSVNHWVTLSVGIACWTPDQDFSPEDVIAAADRALYAAKSAGRNTYHLSPQSDNRLPVS
ncbi:MAG: diguanylate cyclase [Tildeniella nuda ZEHNDER 1965/U140]|jgi:diguanylate cyclase (GGDEF)-like protein|nr:diguanylate cyclase [Tildeniella nuda ZEHNDER 1965/U140]